MHKEVSYTKLVSLGDLKIDDYYYYYINMVRSSSVSLTKLHKEVFFPTNKRVSYTKLVSPLALNLKIIYYSIK